MLASTPVTAATSASSYQSLFFSVFQDAGTRRWTCPSDCVRSCFRCYPRPCDRNRRDRRTAWRKRLRQFRRHGRRRWTCERRKCSLQLKKNTHNCCEPGTVVSISSYALQLRTILSRTRCFRVSQSKYWILRCVYEIFQTAKEKLKLLFLCLTRNQKNIKKVSDINRHPFLMLIAKTLLRTMLKLIIQTKSSWSLYITLWIKLTGSCA